MGREEGDVGEVSVLLAGDVVVVAVVAVVGEWNEMIRTPHTSIAIPIKTKTTCHQNSRSH